MTTETLTDLVLSQVTGTNSQTYRAISARAVDGRTGYRASPTILHSIAHNRLVKINPALVRALAEGLGMDLQRVQLAAAHQYIGLDVWLAGAAAPAAREAALLGDVDVDDMTWDPIPDDHSSDMIVTGSAEVPLSPKAKAALLKHARRVEAIMNEALAHDE